MAGPKIATSLVIDSSNNLLPIKIASDTDAASITLTAGTYYMGEACTEYDTLMNALWSAMNVTGSSLTSTSTEFYTIGLNSEHKLHIVAGTDFTFNFASYSAGSYPLGNILGFNTGQSWTSTGGSMTAPYRIGYMWYGDDLTNSDLNAVPETDIEYMSAAIEYVEAMSGNVMTLDKNQLARRRINLTFIPDDVCYGVSYGAGFPILNGGFETAATSGGGALYWSHGQVGDTAYFTGSGTTSARTTAAWPTTAGSTSASGSYAFELGFNAGGYGTMLDLDQNSYSYSNQPVDLTGAQTVSFDFAFNGSSSGDIASFSFSVLLDGAVTPYTITPRVSDPQADTPAYFDVGSYTGWHTLQFRLTKLGANGDDDCPTCMIDNVAVNRASQHTHTVNASLQSWWIAAKAGARFRYYQDATVHGSFVEYVLDKGSRERFAPERVSHAVDRFNFAFDALEFVS